VIDFRSKLPPSLSSWAVLPFFFFPMADAPHLIAYFSPMWSIFFFFFLSAGLNLFDVSCHFVLRRACFFSILFPLLLCVLITKPEPYATNASAPVLSLRCSNLPFLQKNSVPPHLSLQFPSMTVSGFFPLGAPPGCNTVMMSPAAQFHISAGFRATTSS